MKPKNTAESSFLGDPVNQGLNPGPASCWLCDCG